jgi:hypothetical protein
MHHYQLNWVIDTRPGAPRWVTASLNKSVSTTSSCLSPYTLLDVLGRVAKTSSMIVMDMW